MEETQDRKDTKKARKIKAMKRSAEKLSRRKQETRCGVVQVRVESSGRRGETRERTSTGWRVEEMEDGRGGRESERAPVEIYDRR